MAVRPRTLWWWILLAAAAGVAGFAVFRLHHTAQAEIAAQGELTVRVVEAQGVQLIDEQVRTVRKSLLIELAGFHVDGLGASLARWDAANELVSGTFLWNPAGGFDSTLAWPADAPKREQVEAIWQEFRRWRNSHPQENSWSSTKVPWLLPNVADRTLDDPRFSDPKPRYEGENLDLLRDSGRRVDPWIGWSGNLNEARQPWIIWYQTGPEEPVRGCFVDVRPLLPSLRRLLAAGGAVDLELVDERRAGIAPSTGLLRDLPGYALRATPGELFSRKTAEARLAAGTAALLLAVFLLGVVALGLRTRREARDAGRKITFVTQVSHELRTPLTSIRMFSDLLSGPDVTEEKRLKFAGMIATESSRLSALVERLLAFNALERGKPVECKPLAVDAVVREVVDEMKPTLDEAGLQPALELPPGPAMALGDHSTLKQALLNLVENACKYARGSGALKIAVAQPGRQVVLSVSDRGPGIPPDVRARLFEPFVQGGGSLTTKSPGVGLGLSLARGLLRQAGAGLELLPAESGATFEIRLPAAPANPAAP
ncbi:MAG TPA: HAMP domain-containing sensor histidine kinase [Lacunisphaera sp.]|nr:HAMP domain-containing sensor histidine kinase [Lacunisphaera sp.]